MNIYLSTARIYSKIYVKDEQVQVKNLECSFRDYEFLSKFMKDYMKETKIDGPSSLPPGMAEPFRLMSEMVDLLPVKISKLNAKIQYSVKK